VSDGPAIEALGIEKHFGSVQALAGVDLVAPHGSVLGLLGPNGAGKTTLISAVCNLIRVTAGEVEIELPNQRVRLTDGTFFGEVALLRRTHRSGTVTAMRKTRLLVLDAQDFHALIARMPALAAHVQTTAKARLADSGDLAIDEIEQATERDDQPGE